MPAQLPVSTKRIGDYQYERYDLSGAGSPPRRNPNIPSVQGGEKPVAKSGGFKRRSQTAQGSDTDSGIYQVRSHTLFQRRQPPARSNRPQRDTYFDKVLNNSEASSDDECDNESSYICEDCKMDSANDPFICRRCKMNTVGPHKAMAPLNQRNPRHEPPQDFYDFPQRRRRSAPRDQYYKQQQSNVEDGYSEEEPAPPPRRTQPRPQSEKRRPSARGRPMKPQTQQEPELSDYEDNYDDWHRTPVSRPMKSQKPPPRRNARRGPTRTQREPDYSDFDSNEDDNKSEVSMEEPPRRRSGSGHKCFPKKPAHNEYQHRRPKQVVERKTTTRPSQQNEDEIKIRRKPVPDDYSVDSWSEPSEQSYQTEDTYEDVGPTRRPAQRPQKKVYTRSQVHPLTHIVEHFHYEDDEPVRPQGRTNRPTKSKSQGPHQAAMVGRRMSTNEPKMRTMGVRAANAVSPLTGKDIATPKYL